MSIIIKGMDMPKPDTFNNIIIHSNGQVAMPFWGKGMQAVEGIEAQQLPPHGRLIDADSLYRTIKAECNPYGKPTIDFEEGCKALEIIEHARTIIEAEEEE